MCRPASGVLYYCARTSVHTVSCLPVLFSTVDFSAKNALSALKSAIEKCTGKKEQKKPCKVIQEQTETCCSLCDTQTFLSNWKFFLTENLSNWFFFFTNFFWTNLFFTDFCFTKFCFWPTLFFWPKIFWSKIFLTENFFDWNFLTKIYF